jgi:hypothetical protein
MYSFGVMKSEQKKLYLFSCKAESEAKLNSHTNFNTGICRSCSEEPILCVCEKGNKHSWLVSGGEFLG